MLQVSCDKLVYAAQLSPFAFGNRIAARAVKEAATTVSCYLSVTTTTSQQRNSTPIMEDEHRRFSADQALALFIY